MLILRRARLVRALFLFALCCICAGCTSLESRMDTAHDLMIRAGMDPREVPSQPYPLFSSYKSGPVSDLLTVVIEGDGYAWFDRYTPSDNPTPLDPVGLRIASSLPGPVVYLARPCQYVNGPGCALPVWTSRRFTPDVLASYGQAFDALKSQYNVKNFRIIGFSGGAYIALILAAERNDIMEVTTVAGVLDPSVWANFHDISALEGLEGYDGHVMRSRHVDFLHICGLEDDIVPCSLSERFIWGVTAQGLGNHRLEQYAGEDHMSVWQRLKRPEK